MTLTGFPIHATAAAIDLERARRWYEDELGLVPEREDPGGVWYRFAGDTWLYLYATPSAGTAQNTIAGWTVTDIETVMADLRARGVTFEDYDFGELRDGRRPGGLRDGQGRLVQGQRREHLRAERGHGRDEDRRACAAGRRLDRHGPLLRALRLAASGVQARQPVSRVR